MEGTDVGVGVMDEGDGEQSRGAGVSLSRMSLNSTPPGPARATPSVDDGRASGHKRRGQRVLEQPALFADELQTFVRGLR